MTKWLKTRVKEWIQKKVRKEGYGCRFYPSDISFALNENIFKVMKVLKELEKEGFVEVASKK